MKLNEQQVEAIEEKTGLKPMPDETADESGLAGHFGENSFYIGNNGIFVFEKLPEEETETKNDTLVAVQIAAVEPADDKGVMVRGIEPQATTLKVEVK